MTGRRWQAVALYALAVGFLAMCVPPLARGDTTAPFFLLAPPLGVLAGRRWNSGAGRRE